MGAERESWIEEHGTEALRTALNFSHTSLDRDYVKERAAKELPGFIPDFAGLAQVRAPRYVPDSAILREVEVLGQRGYHAYTSELREPPYARSTVEHPGPTGRWRPCECIVIEGYLGCEYKLVKEFQDPR